MMLLLQHWDFHVQPSQNIATQGPVLPGQSHSCFELWCAGCVWHGVQGVQSVQGVQHVQGVQGV